MRKGTKYYVIVWAILFAIFNVICFVTPQFAAVAGQEYDKFGGAFWAGYAFITIAFIGQLALSLIAFSEKNNQKFFYSLPLISVSYTGLVLTMIFGTLAMVIPDLPNWVGAVVCMVVLLFNMIAVIKAAAAGEIVAETDEKIKAQTQFIKLATANAQNIMNRAKTEPAKAACKKVYESLRYSDPMTNEALSIEEAKITVKLDELSTAVTADAENIAEIAEEVVLIVGERNNKCKVLK